MQYRPVPAPIGPPLSPEEKVVLANRVFHEWFARCFWSWDPSAVITERELPLVVEELRANGGHAGIGSLLNYADRRTRYRPEQFELMRLSQPIDLHALKRQLTEAAAAARALFTRLPVEEISCLYLDPGSGSPVSPEPDSQGFSKLVRHFGSFRGAIPHIIED